MSQLPLLEPLLGTGLALNLAYLNISIFAYLSNIAKEIDRYFDKTDPNALLTCKDSEWFETLTKLSRVEILENNMMFFKKNGRRWIDAPGLWGLLYNILFYYRIAKGVALFLTIYTSVLLFYSVKQSIYTDHWAKAIFELNNIGLHVFISGLAVFWPMFCAAAGTWCRWQAIGLARYQLSKLPQKQLDTANQALGVVEQKLDELRAEFQD